MSGPLPFDTAFNNGGHATLRVPGFGLPIEYWPHANEDGQKFHEAKVRFRHGTNDFRGERLTYREVSMLSLMNALTDKEGWNRKVFDDEIVARWKREAMESDDMMSEKAFEWCLLELRDKATRYQEKQYVLVLDSESCCVKSDVIIGRGLQDELKVLVEPLLNNPNKDWHPNSNDQVLNLIHPSLYPLIYGRTRVLSSGVVNMSDIVEHIGRGEIARRDQEISDTRPFSAYRLDSNPSEIKNRSLWSNRFQWLPAEVKFKGTQGTDVEITSYINNLHPKQHQQLYTVIERIISKSIPLWNEVLIQGLHGRYPERIRTYEPIFEPKAPEWAGWNMEDNEETRKKVREYLTLPDNPDNALDSEDEIPDDWETNSEHADDWPLDRVVDAKWKMMRQVIHPEPGTAFTYEDWKAGDVNHAVAAPRDITLDKHEYYQVRLEETFRERGLQVIVKLASIELTPENPTYPGGSWHLEGMLNEHIVATAIYYYDVENTTPSELHFRQEDIFHECEFIYEQNDHSPVYEVYGQCSDEFSEGISQIGSISTPEGRLLVFPNTLQHCVSGFDLVDPSKPGHRRFLVLWLVDPHLRIVSTANVPPQQHDWWAPSAAENSGINKLPPEVNQMIIRNMDDWPMGIKEAKAQRLELMGERTTYGNAVESNIMEYNLCEH